MGRIRRASAGSAAPTSCRTPRGGVVDGLNFSGWPRRGHRPIEPLGRVAPKAQDVIGMRGHFGGLVVSVRQSWRTRAVRSSAVHADARHMAYAGHQSGHERPERREKPPHAALVLLAGRQRRPGPGRAVAAAAGDGGESRNSRHRTARRLMGGADSAPAPLEFQADPRCAASGSRGPDRAGRVQRRKLTAQAIPRRQSVQPQAQPQGRSGKPRRRRPPAGRRASMIYEARRPDR